MTAGAVLRDEALDRLEAGGGDVLAVLREEARRVAKTRWERTASINDVRPLFDVLGYQGSPNILGCVFRTSEWETVYGKEEQTEVEQGHRRRVRVFRYTGA